MTGFVVECREFKTNSFSNGDTAEWDKRVTQVYRWGRKYMLSDGAIELLLAMLQTGSAFTHNQGRADNIYFVLQGEGYSPYYSTYTKTQPTKTKEDIINVN